MKIKLPLLFIITFLFLSVDGVNAQKFLKKIDIENIAFSKKEVYQKKNLPSKFYLVNINTSNFNLALKDKTKNNDRIIELPNAKGGFSMFLIKETSNFKGKLSEKFSMIKSYSAQGIDDPTAVAKISFGTDGFHAIIFSGKEKTIYVDPYSKDNKTLIVYKRNDLEANKDDFTCQVQQFSNRSLVQPNTTENANDGKLRTFRLALACSGEYAQFHLTNQGIADTETDDVKKAAVLSAMNTTMTRVNGVYEKDLSVRMVLVANNDDIIFLDAATDNITDGSPDLMIDEVQAICDSIIGNANYDIGHLFSIGGDGLAGGGVVCVTGSKALGVTGRSEPIGDAYDVDYVAHEMGHQFGANHTQNNPCNRNNDTAVEPGSASTIMGYAGICSPNVQSNSDDHFHAVSIAEMWNTIQSSASCAVETDTGNLAPTANAGSDFSIPKSTPFVLKGTATDADGMGTLTYNWEQTDNEIATMPPVSTNSGGPMFRSLKSKLEPIRYMPELATVIEGSTGTTWEVLPSVQRDLNFSFLVRDNHAGGGSTARDDMKVSIVDTDAFTVTAPNTAVSWNVGSTQTITWSKGTSDVAPISCLNVNIKLSVDGGITFPIIIKANTPNDGSEDIEIPNNISETARILVEAADNIFYNVNNINFAIIPKAPTVQVLSETCVDQNDGVVNVVVYEPDYDYEVTLNNSGAIDIKQITGTSVSFTDLSPGTYEVCIKTIQLNTTQCYEISILESFPISLRSSTSIDSKTYNFEIENGSAPFSVFLNNELIDTFEDNTFKLELTEGGRLEIKSSKDCEGIFSTNLDTVLLLQNPVNDTIELLLPLSAAKSKLEVVIFDITGNLVFKQMVTVSNRSLSIPFKNYATGIYILKVPSESKSIKILKE
jgi:hypothetical protein